MKNKDGGAPFGRPPLVNIFGTFLDHFGGGWPGACLDHFWTIWGGSLVSPFLAGPRHYGLSGLPGGPTGTPRAPLDLGPNGPRNTGTLPPHPSRPPVGRWVSGWVSGWVGACVSGCVGGVFI